MGKQRSLNPADLERRKEAERRKKINAETRRKNRDEALKRKTEDDLKEEITKIERMGESEGREEQRRRQREQRAASRRSLCGEQPTDAVIAVSAVPAAVGMPLCAQIAWVLPTVT